MNPWWITLPALAAGAGVAAWGARYPGSQIYGPTLRTTGRTKTLALTFDDGPNPACTPELLDMLERYGAKATFFVIGDYVKRAPEIVRETTARGHVVGNHTTTHASLLWLAPERIEEELRRCEEAIEEALGAGFAERKKWMRPPYGSRGPQLEGVRRRMGFEKTVMWSLTAFDWKPQPGEELIRKLGRAKWELGRGRGGDTILLHDGWSRMWNAEKHHLLGALGYWLPRWKDAGVEFVTVEGMAGGN